MLPFRKILIWIKKQHTTSRVRLFLFSGLGAAVFAGISFLVDVLLPWNQWAILVRTIICVPLAVALFVLSYSFVITYVEKKKELAVEQPYETWRERLSPTMRNRIAIIIAAVLFVLMFAVTMKPGYTIAASIIVAIVAGLFTFIRKTSAELRRESIGLPDARDAAFDSHIRQTAKKATLSKKAKIAQEERENDLRKSIKNEENLEK